MAELLEYAYQIEFSERPDYDLIRFQLKKILLDKNIIPPVAFNWKIKYDANKTYMDQAISSNGAGVINQHIDENIFDDLDKLSKSYMNLS